MIDIHHRRYTKTNWLSYAAYLRTVGDVETAQYIRQRIATKSFNDMHSNGFLHAVEKPFAL